MNFLRLKNNINIWYRMSYDHDSNCNHSVSTVVVYWFYSLNCMWMNPFNINAYLPIFLSILIQGWGDSIRWYDLSECWQAARDQRKPIMCIISRPTCFACERFSKLVSSSQEISTLSQHFVMVNLIGNEAPDRKEFGPDGKYFPRIIFFTPEGKVLLHVASRKSGVARYAYDSVKRLSENMKLVRNYFTEPNWLSKRGYIIIQWLQYNLCYTKVWNLYVIILCLT